MIKRILFLIALLFIGLIIYRIVNQDAADALIYNIKNNYFSSISNPFASTKKPNIVISSSGDVRVIDETTDKNNTGEILAKNTTGTENMNELSGSYTTGQTGEIVAEKVYTKKEVETLVQKLIADGVVRVQDANTNSTGSIPSIQKEKESVPVVPDTVATTTQKKLSTEDVRQAQWLSYNIREEE